MGKLRTHTSLHFLHLLVLVPLCFIAARAIPEAVLSAWAWDDQFTGWVNEVLNITPHATGQNGFIDRVALGGAHRWVVDLLTIPITAWGIRYGMSAIEEIRLTHNGTLLTMVEITSRWLGFVSLVGIAVPMFAALFYQVMQMLSIWEPIAILFALALLFLLTIWFWRLPNRRLHHVERVYFYEKLKR